MSLISKDYQAQLQEKHSSDESWGSTGAQLAPAVLALARGNRDILDYGAGKRSLERAIGFPIQNYDPGIEEISKEPVPADTVACIDVLEHIEPEYIEEVLKDLHRVTKTAALFLIHTGPAFHILPDGRNAHLIQKPILWWLQMLAPYFEVYELKKYGVQYVLVLKPV